MTSAERFLRSEKFLSKLEEMFDGRDSWPSGAIFIAWEEELSACVVDRAWLESNPIFGHPDILAAVDQELVYCEAHAYPLVAMALSEDLKLAVTSVRWATSPLN